MNNRSSSSWATIDITVREHVAAIAGVARAAKLTATKATTSAKRASPTLENPNTVHPPDVLDEAGGTSAKLGPTTPPCGLSPRR